MLRKLLATGLLAGLLAGLAVAALQYYVTTPLILAAEVYEEPESPAPAPAVTAIETMADHSGHQHGAATGEPEWKPQEGIQRTAFTSLATMATSIGFAMILLACMLLAGDIISARTAFGWGVAAFVATGLAPSLGLAPLLPGSAAGSLLARQVWWVGTALSTGASLWLLLRADAIWAKALGLALAVAPHLIGAPHEMAYVSKAPAELAARFAAASLSVQAALWIVSGLMAGMVWTWFSQQERA